MYRIVMLRGLVAGCAGFVLIVAGCKLGQGRVTSPDYVAEIRVESVVQGGGVKLNGMMVSLLPGSVVVEVDPAGRVVRQYVISLSTNILGSDEGTDSRRRVTLEPGQPAPFRIYFGGGDAQVTGQAFVTAR